MSSNYPDGIRDWSFIEEEPEMDHDEIEGVKEEMDSWFENPVFNE